jgi:enoyl-CoA hydratase/carnithine racemase
MAVITNSRPEKRSTFDSEMDVRLLDFLAECRERRDVRAILWRGERSVR